MHDNIGLQLGTSLQSAKLQLANLLQNCYFCLIQKTISNSILWLLVIKYFWPGCFAPPYLLRPGATAPLCPPSVTPLVSSLSCSVLSSSHGVSQSDAAEMSVVSGSSSSSSSARTEAGRLQRSRASRSVLTTSTTAARCQHQQSTDSAATLFRSQHVAGNYVSAADC